MLLAGCCPVVLLALLWLLPLLVLLLLLVLLTPLGFACAALAARCVSSLVVAVGFCSANGGVGLAAAGAVAVAAVAGGLVLAAVVACGSASLFGTVLACGFVTSSSTVVIVSECGRLGRGAGCAARCRSSLAEALILLLVPWLGELLANNPMPGFFQPEGLSCRWSCCKSREPMTTTALCTSDAYDSECHPTHDFT